MRYHVLNIGIVGLLLFLVAGSATLASTQHYIGKVVAGRGADATVVSTQISYISPKPPVGQIEMYKPNDARIFMVDGWYCDRETFLAAVQPGQRLHLRNNRHQPVLYGLYSTKPFAAEGIIVDADPESRTVTVRHMVDRKLRKTVLQTYTLPVDGVLRYEGQETTADEALKRGRHVRAHSSRRQTILAITPEAYLDTVEKRRNAWTNLRSVSERQKWGDTWANEGYFAGYYHQWLFFAGEPFRDGENREKLVNTCQPFRGFVSDSLFTAHPLINGSFVSSAAAFRPGGRALFVPDPIHSRRGASHVILHPTDDGHIEGRVERLDGNRLTLLVNHCPSGRVEDFEQKTVRIELADDAEFHLNGIPGAERSRALQTGNTVRVLPAWSGAMLVRDLDVEKGMVSGYGLANKATASVERPITPKETATFHLHFGKVLFSPLSPAQYVDVTFTWADGEVRDLTVFNQRWPGLWKVTDENIDIRFDGDRLTGSLEAHFSGGTISGYGKPGVYRFEIDARVQNHVISGEIVKKSVDGTDAATIKAADVGDLDRRFGGTVQVGPSKDDFGLYRIELHEGLKPVVYLWRDRNGWGQGMAIIGGNRRPQYQMNIDSSQLQLTPTGLSGSLRIELDAVLLKNSAEPLWVTHQITTERTRKPDGGNVPRFEGQYRMMFGQDPILYIGPADTIIPSAGKDSP